MGKVYNNPPLLEAVCEFRFQESNPWNPAFAEYIHNKVKSEFPIFRPRSDIEIRVDNQGITRQSSEPKSLFIREDERALIQVARNLLTINHLKPYPSWIRFRQMIENAYKIYLDIVQPEGLARIGLRYINRIEIPFERQDHLKIDDYLNVFPKTPEGIPDTFASWGQRIEIPFTHSHGLLVLQTANIRESDPQNTAIFIVDLDFVTVPETNINLENALDWIDKAHDTIEKTFESCITEKTRVLFDLKGEL